MSIGLITVPSSIPAATITQVSGSARYVGLAGRALYASLFILAAFGHFSEQTIAYSAQQGVPLAQVLVPLPGVVMIAGGLSILVGYRARLGALLLAAFLVPATVIFHNFWAVADPMMAQLQQAMFLKNVALIGAALLIAAFGSGPPSLDARADRQKVSR